MSGTEERSAFVQVLIDAKLADVDGGRNNSNRTVRPFTHDRRQERQKGEQAKEGWGSGSPDQNGPEVVPAIRTGVRVVRYKVLDQDDSNAVANLKKCKGNWIL